MIAVKCLSVDRATSLSELTSKATLGPVCDNCYKELYPHCHSFLLCSSLLFRRWSFTRCETVAERKGRSARCTLCIRGLLDSGLAVTRTMAARHERPCQFGHNMCTIKTEWMALPLKLAARDGNGDRCGAHSKLSHAWQPPDKKPSLAWQKFHILCHAARSSCACSS